MGLENPKKIENVIPFKKDFVELKTKERQEKGKITDLFRENAEFSLMLASDGEVNMTDHQKAYYLRKLGELRDEAKEVFRELRGVTGFEIPKELQGIQAADDYYKEIKKAV
jgi:hypothetical protein